MRGLVLAAVVAATIATQVRADDLFYQCPYPSTTCSTPLAAGCPSQDLTTNNCVELNDNYIQVTCSPNAAIGMCFFGQQYEDSGCEDLDTTFGWACDACLWDSNSQSSYWATCDAVNGVVTIHQFDGMNCASGSGSSEGAIMYNTSQGCTQGMREPWILSKIEPCYTAEYIEYDEFANSCDPSSIVKNFTIAQGVCYSSLGQAAYIQCGTLPTVSNFTFAPALTDAPTGTDAPTAPTPVPGTWTPEPAGPTWTAAPAGPTGTWTPAPTPVPAPTTTQTTTAAPPVPTRTVTPPVPTFYVNFTQGYNASVFAQQLYNYYGYTVYVNVLSQTGNIVYLQLTPRSAADGFTAMPPFQWRQYFGISDVSSTPITNNVATPYPSATAAPTKDWTPTYIAIAVGVVALVAVIAVVALSKRGGGKPRQDPDYVAMNSNVN